MSKLLDYIKQEFFLFTLLILFIFLSFLYPTEIKNYPKYIHWDTLGILFIMLVITKAIELSGVLYFLSDKFVSRFSKQRHIAMILSLLTVFLSAFLTNDISLFIVMPVAVSMKKYFRRKYWLLVVYIIISANIGSSLTPIGNPQNIYIWRKWDIDFVVFVQKMLLLVLIQLTVLFFMILFTFRDDNVEEIPDTVLKVDKKIFYWSFFWLVLFVVAVELNIEIWFYIVILLFYVIKKPEVFKQSDFSIIMIFMFIFIDFTVLSKSIYLEGLVHAKPSQVYCATALLSQVFSNVPATVFVSNFTDNWVVLTLGANIGAQGLIISSLANIIGIRLVKERGLIVKYHFIGIPFFVVTLLAVYFAYFFNV